MHQVDIAMRLKKTKNGKYKNHMGFNLNNLRNNHGGGGLILKRNWEGDITNLVRKEEVNNKNKI